MSRNGITRASIALLVTAGMTFGLAPPASAAPPDMSPGNIERFFDEHVTANIEDDAIPGAAVTVVSGGQQVFSKGYGVANVESEEPVDPAKTGFFTGSVSKMFISHSAMQQVDAGTLDLDTDVNEYLDDFQIAETYPAKPVTLRHLLTHTGGFDEEMVGLATSDPDEIPELGAFLDDNQPPRVREPGTVVSYDNYGTALAAYLVEQASGQDFADYVDEHLFQPLDMTGTTMRVPHPDDITGDLATLYKADGRTVQDPLYSGMTPAGVGPVTNGADMAKWMNWQLADEPGFDADIVRQIQEIQYQQHDDVPGGLGFLFEEYERGGVEMVNKGGDINGAHAMASLLPEHDTGVFVSFNGDGYAGKASMATTELVNGFVDEFFAESQEELSEIDAGASRYEGYYGQSRTSFHSLLRAAELFSAPASVTANDDGSLTITGLGTEEGGWQQVEPGLFAQQKDGEPASYVGFDDRGNMAFSQAPIITFVPLSWYEHPLLYQLLFLVGFLALIAAAVAFPIVALVRKVKKRPAHSLAAKLARVFPVVMAPLAVAAVGSYLYVFIFDDAALLTGSAVLTSASWWGALLILPGAAIVALALASWVKGWWAWFGRVSYSLLALAVVGFMTTLIRYNLAELPLLT